MDINDELKEIEFVRESAPPEPDKLALEADKQLFLKQKRQGEIKRAASDMSAPL